jgi:hypothetical protein
MKDLRAIPQNEMARILQRIEALDEAEKLNRKFYEDI